MTGWHLLTGDEATIKRVTNQNIKASAKRFFDGKNTVIGVLKPKS